MDIEEIKPLLKDIEPKLAGSPFVPVHTFVRDGRKLTLCVTERLRRRCAKGQAWKSKAMLATMKNAVYGFDPNHAHSPGGYDGIFILTRAHKPSNQMMKKIFPQYIDKPGSGAETLARAMGAELEILIPVRLVSHHMRLLGLLKRNTEEDTLVLVDYDDN